VSVNGRPPLVERGDLWQVGPHLVACIDSADYEAWARFEGCWPERPAAFYFDPPWNDALAHGFYTAAGREHGPGYAELLRTFLARTEGMAQGFVEGSRTNEEETLAICRERYHVAVHPVAYSASSAGARLYHLRASGPAETPDLHAVPAAKLVRACLGHLLAYGLLRRGAPVLDLCLGLGSTMASADALELVCYGAELNPERAAAAIERAQRFGGLQAELLTGLEGVI
jgi:hypothetical protein